MEEVVEIYGIRLPIIEGRCDLAELIVDALSKQGLELMDGDILVITCKIVSKCLGLVVDVSKITPSRRAINIVKRAGGDPRFIELLLRESDEVLFAIPVKSLVDEGLVNLYAFSKNPELARKVLEEYPTVFVVLRDNTYWTDAGLDSSNHPVGIFSVPPRNIDRVAKDLKDRIKVLTGKDVGVVICDTEVFLAGSIDVARGSYGIEPVDKGFGDLDLYGKPKYGGVDAIVHEICSAAALVMRQTSQGVPVVLLRGLKYEKCECSYSDRVKRDPKGNIKILKYIIRHTIRVLGLKRALKIFLSIILS